MSTHSDPSVPYLRRLLRDLVALSGVPGAWVGREPSAIVADFADLLVASLDVDSAFVRLCDPKGGAAVETALGKPWPALLEWLRARLAEGGSLLHNESVPGISDGARAGRGIVVPIGVNAQLGLVAAASDRPDFPGEIDQLLLSVAANHAATAFRMARLVEDHRSAEAALRDSERQLRQARDELEMKVAERTAELRRSEAYLAEAQRLSHTGTWALNRTTRLYVYWSDESYRIWGFDPLQGPPSHETLWQRVHPNDRDRVWKEVEEALRQKADYAGEFRIVLPDGAVKHLKATGHHRFSADGELIEVVGTDVDVTEHKQAEEALRESERKFRDYAETASDWFWEIGPDYKFTLLTENAFGSDPTGRIGTTCWDHALDLETEPEKWRIVRETLDARRPFRDVVYRSAGGNGTPMYVKASGKPVFDTNGEFRGYRGTGTDVTASMLAREEHERLRKLESDLAHMNRLGIIGEQAASLVHEITQPIATARNNARAAVNFLDRQPPELGEVREALDCIVADTDRAREIIDRIRDHIRKAPPRKARFDLNDAIDEVIVLGRSAITKNGILVQTRLAEGLFPVEGDRVQLQQVILNLVLNAVEAMSSVEAGPQDLLIGTEQTQGNGVLVTVRDSGPGIDPENLGRVFEAFYTTKTSGLGIGLSICRSIIDAHGGRLWADANEPRGAVFRFTLPGAENELTNGEPREGTVSTAPRQLVCEGNR
jgi:PAS domain S-box-containing protein